jgi:outer membrane immunogenic protein
MKKTLLATTALVALAVPALAADMRVRTAPPAPAPVAIFNWTGCYIGGNVGGARLKRELTDNFTGQEWSRTGDGVFIVGGQLGCNYQFTNIVLGAEWDFDWGGDNDGGRSVVIGGTTFRASVDNKWMSTLAARFGFTAGALLFFGKVGIGWVKVDDITITNVDTGNSFVGNGSHTAHGPMFGVGLEYGFTNNWSIKAEYDHIRISDRTFTVVDGRFPALVGDSFTSRRGVQQLKFGLNYRFGGLFGGGY